MLLNVFQWRSLKVRVTLFTLGIFLIGSWSLAFYASRLLRTDMQRLLSEQQFSTVSLLAAELNQALIDRLKALESVASSIDPATLGSAATLQARLEAQPLLLHLFNAGVIAYRRDGTAIADVPLWTGRTGVNYMDVDTVAAALNEGKTTIGRPLMGKKLLTPVFGMTVPMRDRQGRVIGALAGVTNLDGVNFLSTMTQSRYGKTGGYLLIAPQYRLVVTASDRSRVMEQLPAPGLNPMIDRFIAGYEGSAVLVNPLGVEMLASDKGVPVAGWILSAVLPTSEAFAPIRRMQLHMLLATLLFTLLASGLTWWVLRRQLAPVLAAAKALACREDVDQPPLPLPNGQRDEIGDLIEAFNQLLARLAQREEALRETKRFLKESQRIAGVGSYVLDLASGVWKSSDVFDRVFGIDPGYERDLAGWVQLIHPEDRAMLADYLGEYVLGQGHAFDKEYRILRHSDQALRWVHGLGHLEYDVQGQPVNLHGTIQDTTTQKMSKEALRIAATAFESHEGIFVTDAARVILRVNKAFTRITGYSAQEAVGQNPRLLKSGRHDAAFYAAIWESVAQTGAWQGEIWNRKKGGEVYAEGITISAVLDDSGQVTHYVATFTDITARKEMEEQIRQLAFYDPLTHLPNRRLLNDRLTQTIAASRRSACYGALMILDLDNFKPLNDQHGHAAGDLLLIEVANRLKNCVREVDTVARFGGDEFVAILSDLDADRAESAAQAAIVAEKIRLSLSEPYRLTLQREGKADTAVEHHCTASIGVTLFLNHEVSQDDILKWADAAMYQAKAQGRNQVWFHDPKTEHAQASDQHGHGQ
jgi:diguanylate cyclase (GGDEF)-like protein/PAS domain S-box-containing protein